MDSCYGSHTIFEIDTIKGVVSKGHEYLLVSAQPNTVLSEIMR